MTAVQHGRLAGYEQTIERGLRTFVEVGQALLAVSEEGLYVEGYGTFEAYCKDRWGLSYSRAGELIRASGAAARVAGTASIQAVEVASQAIELSRVPQPEQVEVWREAVERTGGKPTAAAVRAVREERAPAVTPPAPVGDLPHETTRPAVALAPPLPSMDAVMAKLAESDPTLSADLQASRVRADVAKINHLFSVLGLHGGPEQVVAALGVDQVDLAAFAGECGRWSDALRRLTAPGPRLVGGRGR